MGINDFFVCNLNTMHQVPFDDLFYRQDQDSGISISFEKLLEGDLFGGRQYQGLNLPPSTCDQQRVLLNLCNRNPLTKVTAY